LSYTFHISLSSPHSLICLRRSSITPTNSRTRVSALIALSIATLFSCCNTSILSKSIVMQVFLSPPQYLFLKLLHFLQNPLTALTLFNLLGFNLGLRPLPLLLNPPITLCSAHRT